MKVQKISVVNGFSKFSIKLSVVCAHTEVDYGGTILTDNSFHTNIADSRIIGNNLNFRIYKEHL